MLWAPYAEEAPMDLTTKRTQQQETNVQTAIKSSSPYSYIYRDAMEPQLCVDVSLRHSSQKADERIISSTQLSPESIGSNVHWSPPSIVPCCAAISPQPHLEVDDFETLDANLEYQEFERDALTAMAERNGGTLLGNNPRMRRAIQTKEVPDDSYRKQRDRNNYAAKQSRDRRKLREVRLALQVTFLKKKMTEMQRSLAGRVCEQCRRRLL